MLGLIFTKNADFSAGKPTVHLTSDSPALNGSCISFTAKLEYPPCQKEDANGDIVWDEHCEDGTELEASGVAKAQPGDVPKLNMMQAVKPKGYIK